MPNATAAPFSLCKGFLPVLFAMCKVQHLQENSTPNRSIIGKSVILIKSNQSAVDSITPHQIQCDPE